MRHTAAAQPLVVAASDFTPLAGAAARRAAELARAAGGRLALLHVVSPVGRLVAPLLEAIGAEARPSPGEALERLRRHAARLNAEFRLPAETHLASGSAAEAIVQHAQNADAALIVVGNRGGSLLRDLLGANTAQRVRRRVGIPVLAVSTPAEASYSRVMLAADLSPGAAHAGRVARRLLPNAQLNVLHVCEPVYEGALSFAGVNEAVLDDYRRRNRQEAHDNLQRFMRDAWLGFDAQAEVQLGNPAARIREHAEDIGAQLLVLRPSASRLERGMATSVTAQILADPPCDVLLVS